MNLPGKFALVNQGRNQIASVWGFDLVCKITPVILHGGVSPERGSFGTPSSAQTWFRCTPPTKSQHSVDFWWTGSTFGVNLPQISKRQFPNLGPESGVRHPTEMTAPSAMPSLVTCLAFGVGDMGQGLGSIVLSLSTGFGVDSAITIKCYYYQPTIIGLGNPVQVSDFEFLIWVLIGVWVSGFDPAFGLRFSVFDFSWEP